MAETRRERLLRFVALMAVGGFEREYSLTIGRGRGLPFTVLTDDALEDLAERMVRDFWRHKRSCRISQAHYAAQRISA